MAFDTRHRDKNGEISRKHGNTFIHTLRETYGPGFASGCADNAKLGDVLDKLDEPSLSHLSATMKLGSLNKYASERPNSRLVRLSLGAFSALVQVKNPNAPAVKREAEEDWGRR
jgi:hypothetical protein